MEICPEETTIITVIPTDNNFDITAVTYQWTFNTGVITTATTNTLEIVGQAGYGTYTVTVNNSGCTTMQTFDITASTDEWDITFNGTSMLCPDETGTLTATVTNNTENSPVTYTFTLPDTSEVVSTTNSLPISEIGIYTVEVDILGCTSTQTFEVFASDVVWDVTFNGSATLCPDESGTLTATVNNNTQNLPVTYTFTLPNASQIVSANNVLPITDTGVYTVVVSILGCESNPVTFTVNQSVADWQIQFTGTPYVICEGESTTLAFTATNFDIDATNVSYSWSGPNGLTGQGKTFTTNQLGTYTLSVNILGCISIFNVDVVANDLAIAIDFTQGCENNLYRLVALPLDDSFDVLTSTFVWTGPNVVSTDMTNAIVLGANGDYTVTVTNAEGCSASETITVNNISCIIQKGISPNNDTLNDFFDLSALNVKELFIYNRYGTEVYKFRNYTNQWYGQSNTGDELPDGTYFYIIHTVEGENISGWIFINR
jgi:gliding motility-associated-like protein